VILLLNLLFPGEIIPHHSLISFHVYHGTVSALVTSEVERISAHDWYLILKQKPEKYREIASVLQENLRKMQKRIDMITLPSKDQISYFREWLSIYCGDYPMEEILTQEEIGQFLGMSRETVNRQLRKSFQ
jgi:CRP/FNR family transcriptional regulator, cyclic AMP receptor protein